MAHSDLNDVEQFFHWLGYFLGQVLFLAPVLHLYVESILMISSMEMDLESYHVCTHSEKITFVGISKIRDFCSVD